MNRSVRAAVIGSPISHSLSPFIFSFIAHKEKINVQYDSTEVMPSNSDEFLSSLRNEKDFLGVNVTLPLKELFLDKIETASPVVRALGALNVLHLKAGKLHGHNTDIIGIEKTFSEKKFSLKNINALILGAGGSAKAVAYVLGKEGASEVIIFNRSDRNNEVVKKFSELFPATKWMAVNDLGHSHLVKMSFDLAINTTPLGMTGKDSGTDFFNELKKVSFNKKSMSFDLIYTPEVTEFMKVTGSLGLTPVGGLGMLIDQALATWKIWVGNLQNEKKLHLELRDFLNGILWLKQNDQPLYLSGFMGVGKSCVGQYLSALLKRNFLDTDKLIQESAQLSIPEIFAQGGEAYFREIESQVVSRVASGEGKKAIVSLGGGVLINEKNLKALHDSGLVIYLKAIDQKLLERINSQKEVRPLLANMSSEEQLKKIAELMTARKDIYEKAPIHIQTDHMSVEDCSFEIISTIGKMQRKDKK